MIDIIFRSYSKKWIEKSYTKVNSVVTLLDGEISPLRRLKRKWTRLTVLKSPHVNHKAKDQFAWITYKGKCEITWKEGRNELESALLFLALSTLKFPGTELEIKNVFSTAYKPYDRKLETRRN